MALGGDSRAGTSSSMKLREVGQCAAGALLIHSECCVSITGDRVGGGWEVIDRVRDVETLNASFGAVCGGCCLARRWQEGWSRSRRCLRPSHPGNARSRLISEAKQGRAWLVLGWETSWEYRVL